MSAVVRLGAAQLLFQSSPFNPVVNRYGLLSYDRIKEISLSGISTPMLQGSKAGDVSPRLLDEASVSSKTTFRSLLSVAHTAVYLPPGECTMAMTIFNMANCLIGSGILGLPYALKVGGWFGLLIMFFTTTITAYTAKVIGRCIQHLLVKYPGANKDRYQDMAEMCCENRTLGKIFRIIINISLVLELWGSCCSRIVLQGSNLNKVFPSYSEQFFMVLCTIILIPSVFIGMEYLAYLSMAGLTSSSLLLVGILAAGVDQGVANDTILLDLKGLPMTFGLILFSYAGHAVFPQIYRSMENKEDYSRSVDSAFYISFGFYALMATGGYLFWGASVLDQITLNLPQGPLSHALILLMVLNNMLSYPLTMTAPIEATEEVLGLTSIRVAKPFTFFVGSLILRSSLVLGTLGVALGVSNFASIATFIGAVFTMSVSLIFPAVILLKMMYFNLPSNLRQSEGLGLSEVIFNLFLIFVGVFGMITGVASIFHQE